jgi:hypothetical protein
MTIYHTKAGYIDDADSSLEENYFLNDRKISQ